MDDEELTPVPEEGEAPTPTEVPLAIRKVFEVENYRRGTVQTVIRYEDGDWSATNPFGLQLIESAKKLYSTDEERIRHFSNFTNQTLAFRLVEDD